MANAVSKALEKERHLAVQAGTGTGKSLAYLVPAIRHAMNSGSTVVVSTATLALQRQLVERDLPRLTEALADVMERTPTFAIMKGRNNYLCMNKIAATPDDPEALIDESEISHRGKAVRRIHDGEVTVDYCLGPVYPFEEAGEVLRIVERGGNGHVKFTIVP